MSRPRISDEALFTLDIHLHYFECSGFVSGRLKRLANKRSAESSED